MNVALRDEKIIWREKYRKARADFKKSSLSEQAEKDICKQLREFIEEQQLSTVAIFIGLSEEVDLRALLSFQRVDFVLPKVFGNKMGFLPAAFPEKWVKNHLGILEPPGDWQDCVPLNQIELVMVPGVAFDRLGGRIGMGKGFYDRALEEFSGVKMAPAFVCQISEDLVPMEPHDLRMDFIVTEKYTLKTQMNLVREK